MCRLNWYQWTPFVFFSVDIAFVSHFGVPTYPCRSACGIGYVSKKQTKWWTIQLIIHSTAGLYIADEKQ